MQAVADRAFGDVQLGGESANGRAFIVRPRSQLTDTPIITSTTGDATTIIKPGPTEEGECSQAIEVDTGDADMEAAPENLRQNVIPRVREAGARAGYWLDGTGCSFRVSMMLFDPRMRRGRRRPRSRLARHLRAPRKDSRSAQSRSREVVASF